MKNAKKLLSGALSVALIAALGACNNAAPTGADTPAGDTSEETTTTSTMATTTTFPTVEIITTTFADEEQVILNNAAEKLPDIELANKELKWLAHYDVNPNVAGQPKTPALQLFEQKYGGSVKWYETTWNTRFDDLSRYVLGGEGIDFFPGDDNANYPKGVINGMFEPVDDYINLDDPIWDNLRPAMELINFGGKHYQLVNSVTASNLCSYNTETMEANGFDDPYELWQAGEWNWDTFKSMMSDFVDVENGMYGLDGWFFENAFLLSSGMPVIGAKDGKLVSNLETKEIEDTMNFAFGLWQDGLIKDKSLAGWTTEEFYMGEGKELFYITGFYAYTSDPSTWTTKIPPENVMVVPVPSPAGATPASSTTLGGYAILKGASNPEGVAAFNYCQIVAAEDEEIGAISDRQMMENYLLTPEVLKAYKEVNLIARDNPIMEFMNGSSDDIVALTDGGSGGLGTRAAFTGSEWAANRDQIAGPVQLLVDDLNAQLEAVVNS
jgi:hypothetical protein